MASNAQAGIRERYEKAKALVAGGSSVSQAVIDAGTSMPTFKKMKAAESGGQAKPAKPGPKPKKPKTHEYVDLAPVITAPNPYQNVAVIVCTAEQIGNVLRGLK